MEEADDARLLELELEFDLTFCSNFDVVAAAAVVGVAVLVVDAGDVWLRSVGDARLA